MKMNFEPQASAVSQIVSWSVRRIYCGFTKSCFTRFGSARHYTSVENNAVSVNFASRRATRPGV